VTDELHVDRWIDVWIDKAAVYMNTSGNCVFSTFQESFEKSVSDEIIVSHLSN